MQLTISCCSLCFFTQLCADAIRVGTGGAADEVTRVDGENNDYSGDFTTSAGLIYYKDAAAVLTAIGPSVQTTGSDVRAMYQGDLIVGRMAMGVGTLNPAAAIELQAAA